MAKSPFYIVKIKSNQFDLTEFITSFKYEMSIKKDNILDLRLKTNNIQILDPLSGLKEGNLISFRFGYKEGSQSKTRYARIANIDPVYGQDISINLKATDLGISMKKNTSDRVWEKVTSSTIAKSIATKYQLTPVVDDTTIVYNSYPQGNKTDYEFLHELAMGEDNGEFRFYLEGEKLVFSKRNLLKNSVRKLNWNNGNGSLITFKPSSRETNKKGSSKETSIIGIDPLLGSESKKSNNDLADAKLGKYPIHFNNDGEQLTNVPVGTSSNQSDVTGDKVVLPVSTPQNAKNIADKIKKEQALKDFVAVATIEMDPFLEPDQIVSVGGVAPKDTGNWYIESISFQIGGSEATCSLNLTKNAVSRPVEDDSVSPVRNETVGPDNTERKKEVDRVFFDNDGVQI